MVALSKEVLEKTRYTPLSVFAYLSSRNVFERHRESYLAYIRIKRTYSSFYCFFTRASIGMDPDETMVIRS